MPEGGESPAYISERLLFSCLGVVLGGTYREDRISKTYGEPWFALVDPVVFVFVGYFIPANECT
jgi:hypothetical protein